MNTINVLDALEFASLVVATVSIVGEAVREIIHTLLKVSVSSLELSRRLILDFALGSAFIALMGMIFSSLGVSFQFLVTIPIAATFVVATHYLMSYRHVWTRLSDRLGSTTLADLILPASLASIVTATFLLRLFPLFGYYVYSGRDITWYTLITERVSQDGHFAGWGAFAGPSWNVGVDAHLIFEGFHVLTTLFSQMSPLGAPQIVSYTLLVFNAYISLAVYFLVITLSKSRILGLSSAIVVALVSPYPAFFLLWGGVAEVANWVIVPVAIGLLTQVRSMRDPNAWLCMILAAGSIVIHPISSVYFFGFAFTLVIGGLILRRRNQVFTFVAIASGSLLVVAPFLINAFGNVSAQAAALPAGTFGWEGFQSKVLFSPADIGASWWNLLTFTTNWLYAPVVVLSGLLGTLLAIREKWERYLIAWLLMLVLLNENGPFGLYLLRFPFWWMLFPERFALVAFIPLSILSAKFMLEISRKLPQMLPRFSYVTRRRSVILGAVVVISLVAVQNYATLSSSIPWANGVTGSDVKAFQWMVQNLSPNSTVLVNDNDSGWWIPAFTGIKVFGISPMITSPTVRADSDRLKYLIIAQPNSSETFSLLKKYGITHIFFGEKTTYGLSRPDLSFLLAKPTVYPLVYHSDNVFIFDVSLPP